MGGRYHRVLFSDIRNCLNFCRDDAAETEREQLTLRLPSQVEIDHHRGLWRLQELARGLVRDACSLDVTGLGEGACVRVERLDQRAP